MARVKFEIPGNPKGKGRPRMTRTGHAYTPKDTIQYENLVKFAFVQEAPNWKPREGTVWAIIRAYFQIPKSWSQKKKEAAIAGKIRPTGKPDLDNIQKSILDSLNGIAYHDDAQVVVIQAEKKYSEQPRVEATLTFEDKEEEEKK